MQFYTDENRDVFPAHRNQNESDNATTALTNWWGTAVIGYARNQSNLFCCPAIKGRRLDNGLAWDWSFDCHKVGYGINSWFLSYWPYSSGSMTVGGVRFDTRALVQAHIRCESGGNFHDRRLDAQGGRLVEQQLLVALVLHGPAEHPVWRVRGHRSESPS